MNRERELLLEGEGESEATSERQKERPEAGKWWVLVAVGIGAYAFIFLGLFSAMISVGPSGGTMPAASFLLMASGVLLGMSAFIYVPVGMWLDLRQIREAGGQWNPHENLYVLGGLLLTPIAAALYLWNRRKYYKMS